MSRLGGVLMPLMFLVGSCIIGVASGFGAPGTGFGAAPKDPSAFFKPDESAEIQTLIKFLTAQKAKGIDGPDCSIRLGYDKDSGRRGVFATQRIKKGKLVCQIPSDCALALSDPSKKGEDAPTIAHGGANLLDMYMLKEDARAFWAPYLDTLPADDGGLFDPTPDFYDDEQLELLELPRAVDAARQRKKDIEALAAERNMDLARLQFATWLVSSRAFRITMSSPEDEEADREAAKAAENDNKDGNEAEPGVWVDDRGQVVTKTGEGSSKSIRVLVPFLDMVNHSSDQPNVQLTLIDPEKDEAWFALETLRPIQPGKELVLSYGSGVASSIELLLDYGFVPPSNNIDHLLLKKGGDGLFGSASDWSTTLEEDQTMRSMLDEDQSPDTSADAALKTVLDFRIKMKEAYAN